MTSQELISPKNVLGLGLELELRLGLELRSGLGLQSWLEYRNARDENILG